MNTRRHELHQGFSHEGTRNKREEIPPHIDSYALCRFQLLGRIG